ncbi:hypothetical protein BHM03_00035950 [Ensete ventricosum]|nr:hypothetical protein BHM03_00035950 [Ensete ventricosum]
MRAVTEAMEKAAVWSLGDCSLLSAETNQAPRRKRGEEKGNGPRRECSGRIGRHLKGVGVETEGEVGVVCFELCHPNTPGRGRKNRASRSNLGSARIGLPTIPSRASICPPILMPNTVP